jgi:hypothetical protein
MLDFGAVAMGFAAGAGAGAGPGAMADSGGDDPPSAEVTVRVVKSTTCERWGVRGAGGGVGGSVRTPPPQRRAVALPVATKLVSAVRLTEGRPATAATRPTTAGSALVSARGGPGGRGGTGGVVNLSLLARPAAASSLMDMTDAPAVRACGGLLHHLITTRALEELPDPVTGEATLPLAGGLHMGSLQDFMVVDPLSAASLSITVTASHPCIVSTSAKAKEGVCGGGVGE